MNLHDHPFFQDRLKGATRVAVDIVEKTHPGFSWNLNPDGSVSITKGRSKAIIQNEFALEEGNEVFSGLTYTQCILRDRRWVPLHEGKILDTNPKVLHNAVDTVIQEVFT